MASLEEQCTKYISNSLQITNLLRRITQHLLSTRFKRKGNTYSLIMNVVMCVIFVVSPIEAALATTQPTLPTQELQALIDIYNSTGGDNWPYNGGWLKSNDACSWSGVQCESVPAGTTVTHVISLGLEPGGMNGSIPASISNLTELQTLIINGQTHLTGPIPSSIGELVNLKTLYLSEDNLSGSIPDSIGNLRNLVTLVLGVNSLTGSIPDTIGNLSSLQVLDLGINNFSGQVPSTIGNLGNLRLLNLDDDNLSGPITSEIGNLSELQYLYLGDNKFTGGVPISIWHMSNLRGLSLNFMPSLGGSIPPDIGYLTNIESIDLFYDQIGGPIPAEIGELHHLRDLNLEYNNFTSLPPEIGNDTALLSLRLDGNDFTKLPDTLSQLASLQSLTMGDIYLTEWPQSLPSSLEYLFISTNWEYLTGPYPTSWSNLVNLKSADLPGAFSCLPPELAYWKTALIGAGRAPLCASGSALAVNATIYSTNFIDSHTESTDITGSTINATFPLGAQFYIQLKKKLDDSLVNGTYTLGNAEVSPSLSSGSIFTNDVAIEFGSTSADFTKYFRAVHLGTETLTITPSDSSLSPVTVQITVDNPSSLGSNNNQYDQDIVHFANQRGIPPQFIKGQIQHESKFDPTSYRYEPLSSDYKYISTGQNLRLMEPYDLYRLATIDGLSQGIAIKPEDISSRNNYWINVNGTVRKITDSDTDVGADNIYNNNDAYQHWSWASPLIAQTVDSDPTALQFTAQTPIAGSYGLLQILYATAIAPMDWTGAGGQKNPSYLFDTSDNMSNGGGSLGLGTGYFVHLFPLVNPVAQYGDPAYALPSDFVDAYEKTYSHYNCGYDMCPSNYGQDVIDDADAYTPVRSTNIFQ